MNASNGGLRAALAVAFASFWTGAPVWLGWRWRSDVEVLAVLVVGSWLLLAWPAVMAARSAPEPLRAIEPYGLPEELASPAPAPRWLAPPFWFAVVTPLAALFLAVHSLGWADLQRGAAPGDAPSEVAQPPGARLERGVLRPVEVRVTGRDSGAGGGSLTEEKLLQAGHPPLTVSCELLPGESRAAAAWMVGPAEPEAWEAVGSAVAPAGDSAGNSAGVSAGVSLGAPSGRVLGEANFEAPDWARRGLPGGEGQERSGGGGGLAGGGFPWAGWLAAVAGAVAATALRRARLSPAARGGLLVLLGAASAAAAWALAARGTPAGFPAGFPAGTLIGASSGSSPGAEGGSFVEVFEGRRLADGNTEWVRIRRQFGGVLLRGSRLAESLDGTFDFPLGASVAESRVQIAEEGPVASILMASPFDPIDWLGSYAAGLRLLRPSVNTWGEFELAWVREGSGAWHGFGAWGLGTPLEEPVPGAPQADAAGLPGWCASGLPQGRTVLVGRLASGSDGAQAATWVRLVGFQP